MFSSVYLHDAVVTAVAREGDTVVLTIESAWTDSPQPGVGEEIAGQWLTQCDGRLAFEEVRAIALNGAPAGDILMHSENDEILVLERRAAGVLFLGILRLTPPLQSEFAGYDITCARARWTARDGHAEVVAA